jgi:hypothetical protein
MIASMQSMMIDPGKVGPEMMAQYFFAVSKEITARQRQERDSTPYPVALLDTRLRHVDRSINGNSSWRRGNFVMAGWLTHTVNCT